MDSDEVVYGDAPCGGCGRHIENIELIPSSRKPDEENGGWWWQCAPGQKCQHCGEPLNWYHKKGEATREQ